MIPIRVNHERKESSTKFTCNFTLLCFLYNNLHWKKNISHLNSPSNRTATRRIYLKYSILWDSPFSKKNLTLQYDAKWEEFIHFFKFWLLSFKFFRYCFTSIKKIKKKLHPKLVEQFTIQLINKWIYIHKHKNL